MFGNPDRFLQDLSTVWKNKQEKEKFVWTVLWINTWRTYHLKLQETLQKLGFQTIWSQKPVLFTGRRRTRKGNAPKPYLWAIVLFWVYFSGGRNYLVSLFWGQRPKTYSPSVWKSLNTNFWNYVFFWCELLIFYKICEPMCPTRECAAMYCHHSCLQCQIRVSKAVVCEMYCVVAPKKESPKRAASWYNGWCSYHTTSTQAEEIILQRHRNRNGRCITILFTSITLGSMWLSLDTPTFGLKCSFHLWVLVGLPCIILWGSICQCTCPHLFTSLILWRSSNPTYGELWSSIGPIDQRSPPGIREDTIARWNKTHVGHQM